MDEGLASEGLLVPWAEGSYNVLEVVGEPAIVINGVPALLPVTENGLKVLTTTREGSSKDEAIAKNEKLEGLAIKGRTVRKKFGRRVYLGEVTAFDPSTNWYTVLYEDGDTEELEWEELQIVLLQPGSDIATRSRFHPQVDSTMKLRERKNKENEAP